MAFLDYRELLADAVSDEDPDQAELIGAVGIGGSMPPAMAMRIGPSRKDPSQMVYLEEVPVFYPGHVERRDLFGGRRWRRLHRLEVKAARSQPGIATGYCVLMAELPYSSCVTAGATFKPGYKDRLDEKPLPPAAVAGDVEWLGDWLAAQTFDYWESDRFLTAASPELDPPPVFVRDARTPKGDSGLALGLCEDYPETLRALRKSTEFREIIDDTQAGKRRWWKAGTKRRELRGEVEEHLEGILNLAVRQAMAGPHNSSESARLIGTSVMEKAGFIFNGHVKRLDDQAGVRDPLTKGKAGGEAGSKPLEELPTAELDTASPGVEDHLFEATMQRYQVNLDGAVYIISVLKKHHLDDASEKTQRHAAELLARVWKLPKPDPRTAALRAYVEGVMADDEVAERLPEALRLVAEATAG